MQMLEICALIQLIEFNYMVWSNGQSSWLQIQRSGFDSRHYQIFWEVVYLEQGPLSLVSAMEEKVAALV
jgi:hypothetical protein